MRYSRSNLLPAENATVHKYWRCHNRAYLLAGHHLKTLYLKCTEIGLNHRNTDNQVKVHAYSLMENHVHQIVSYSGSLAKFCHFMRVSHGIFGRRFNRLNKRSGAVANDRPKTALLQNDFHSMRAQFYVEANPIRARICTAENLKLQTFTSYRYYAYGIIDAQTKLIHPPDWYLRLGDTPKERQAKYRSLFKAYLEKADETTLKLEMITPFVGEKEWVDMQKQRALRLCKDGFAAVRAPPS